MVSESITPTSHGAGFSSNWHPKLFLNNGCRLMEPAGYWLCVSSTNPFLFCFMSSTERLHPIYSCANAKVISQGVVFKLLKSLFKSVNVAGSSYEITGTQSWKKQHPPSLWHCTCCIFGLISVPLSHTCIYNNELVQVTQFTGVQITQFLETVKEKDKPCVINFLGKWLFQSDIMICVAQHF